MIGADYHGGALGTDRAPLRTSGGASVESAAVALPLTVKIDGKPRDDRPTADVGPRLSEAEIMKEVARDLAAVQIDTS